LNLSGKNFQLIGCGDIGQRIAACELAQNHSFLAVVRSSKSLVLCQSAGLNTQQVDFDSSKLEDFEIAKDAVVIYLVPPPGEGKKDSRLAAFLARIRQQPKKIVLISTTGVYGDCQGNWIDENTIVAPGTDRARRRLDAELQIIRWATTYDRSYMILRVPGIYAQDRLPLERLRKGLPVLCDHEAPFTNRIHAEDLARISLLVAERELSSGVINVCDGNPCTMTEYFNQIASAVGLPLPPQVSLQQAKLELSPGMLSYLAESRRIKNDRLLELLNYKFLYPDLADTLACFPTR
jgi:nucleoside-diphosphate-sugar epimerase